MSQLIEPVSYAPVPPPNPVRWTRQQCRAMMENGILTGRYELIEGEILSKMGQKRPHAYVITRLTAWLFILFGADFVQFQLPIQLPGPDNDTSEPEPDAAVLSRPASDFQDTPEAAYVQLVIEVSDTTLTFDKSTKASLYARAGIPEYWIVDINSRQVLVYRHPSESGYDKPLTFSADAEVATLARPDSPVRISDLLPEV